MYEYLRPIARACRAAPEATPSPQTEARVEQSYPLFPLECTLADRLWKTAASRMQNLMQKMGLQPAIDALSQHSSRVATSDAYMNHLRARLSTLNTMKRLVSAKAPSRWKFVCFHIAGSHCVTNVSRKNTSHDPMSYYDLMQQLERVLEPRTSSFGTRGLISVTRYEPTGSLRVFLEEVLPVWTVEDHTTEVNRPRTEAEATRCLHMLKVAHTIHLVIQAYGINVQTIYTTDAFEQSPVIVEMLQICWREGFMDDEVDPLKRARTFVDLILHKCPNFYQLYTHQKAKYDQLVYTLDTNSLTSWSNSCRCGTDLHTTHG